MASLIDFLLRVDEHLVRLVAQYGLTTYGLLAGIIFAETGFVVMPFLPGDSLLFAAGTLSATTLLDPLPLFLVLTTAAIAGDNTNYWIGRLSGQRLIASNRGIVRPAHLERANRFYDRYGPITVVLARFVPLVRTFAPFAAGLTRMAYPTFFTYSVIGGTLWIGLFVWGGYFFGTIPVVRDHFDLVVLVVIAVSVLPPLFELVRRRFSPKS
jgi:membrane-associated protein